MEKLKKDIESLIGLRLTGRQCAAFQRYEQELLEWNARFNLTAIRESEGIRTKHFLDSLSCMLAFREKIPTTLVDVGTGAGFPGIPLKIILPDLKLTLIESVGKKANYCQHMVKVLSLENVEVVQARAEEAGQNPAFREKFDWAVARAVAGLPTLIEYLLPLVRVGGAMLAQKGESGPAEAHAADKAAHLLGGKLRQIRQLNLPGVVEDRFLIIFDKVAATPSNYPRRVGQPTGKPLA